MPQGQLELIDSKDVRFSLHLPSLLFSVSFVSLPSPPQTLHPYPHTGFQCSSRPHAGNLDFRLSQNLKSYQPDTGFSWLQFANSQKVLWLAQLNKMLNLGPINCGQGMNEDQIAQHGPQDNSMDIGMGVGFPGEERSWKSRMAVVHCSSPFAQHISFSYIWFPKCSHLHNPTIPHTYASKFTSFRKKGSSVTHI